MIIVRGGCSGVRIVPPCIGYVAGLIPSVTAFWEIRKIAPNPASISRPAEMRLSDRSGSLYLMKSGVFKGSGVENR